LLAHSEWKYVTEQLEDQGMPELTPSTITTLEGLADELERVRERGYAYDDEETLVGLRCVAAPIYSSEGTVVAAISFSVPAYRFTPRQEAFTAAVLDAARRISDRAGPTLEEYPSHKV
jgi:DNA-binding IclR family transcriptional regulator